MKIKLLIFCLIYSSTAFGQIKLSNYSELNNSIKLVIEIESIQLLSQQSTKSPKKMDGFFDVGKAGEYALPSRDIFVAIPEQSKIDITSSILESNDFNFELGFNPKAVLLNDSTTSYTFESLELKPLIKKNTIEIMGFLWIEDIYCAHLRINQYEYNELKKNIYETKKIEINISTNKQIPNFVQSQKSFRLGKEKPNPYIINNEYAEKFRSNKVNLFQTDSTNNWIDFNSQYIKIGTAIDGIYKLYKSDLENQTLFNSSVNPKTFKLFLEGKEIPIFVSGQEDGTFDDIDYIEFVGIRNIGGHHRELSNLDNPYNEYLGRYSDTTIYWLTWNGIDGKRVTVSNNTIIESADTLDYYLQIDHYEKNAWFDFAASNLVRREKPFWLEYKTWHEGNINLGIKNKDFSVSNIVPNKEFKMFVKMQNFVSNISTNAHQISLGLNLESWSDSIYIDKYEKIVLQTKLSTNLLEEGNNVLNINSVATVANINVLLFDWYEIEYPRFLIPTNSMLKFSFPFIEPGQERNIILKNIVAENYLLWQYGSNYKKYVLNKIDNNLIFADSILNDTKFIYLDDSKVLTPKIYYSKQFKDLRNTINKADYLAITHKKFKSKVDEYIQFISNNYNVETKIIDIDDIYDEYSFGFFNPEAIRDFLKSTHSFWQDPKPRDVFLIGGATYDYYGNKFNNISSVKERVINYIPSFGAPVSDSWFVSWDTTGAHIPQLNIGRLPVTTNEELEWYFEKHQNYVSQEYDDWNKRYLFLSSGDANNPSELNLLKSSNQFVIDNYVDKIPIGGKAVHFYKTIDPPTNFGPYSSSYFQQEIDKGSVFISYLGHSGTQIWDNSITEAIQLMNNRSRYPIVSDFGCSTGKFAEPDISSFSELFTLGSDGQAIVYVGNSSLGFLSSAVTMPKLFYSKILSERIFKVSEAHKLAKLQMLQNFGVSETSQLFYLTNILIGDPIISLPIPKKPNIIVKQSDIIVVSDLLVDLQDSTKIKIPYSNYGSVLDDSIDIMLIHKFQEEIDSIQIRKKMPIFEDSLLVNIHVKNKAGLHTLHILFDPQNEYDEIVEDDNETQISFNISSSAVRQVIQYQIENGLKDFVNILNPTLLPISESIIFNIASNNNFDDQLEYEIPFGELYTKFEMPELPTSQRYWGRIKINGDDNFSSTFSFLVNRTKMLLKDSISFAKTQIENIKMVENTLLLDSSSINIEVFSAGFNDGQAAVISRNEVNYVPTPLVGHHIALFNVKSPHSFVEYKYFNTLAGGENITNYIQFLDTLTANYFVAIAISDEGTPRNEDLKNLIKSLGSKYIDNVGWRSSWAFIGRKGATIGSMPELYSKQGTGSVTIDTTISFLHEKGDLLTSNIGSSTNWNNLIVNQVTPSNSVINFIPIGIKKNGVFDTLAQLSFQDSVADISHIDALLYPKLKILAEFNVSDDLQSPILKSIGVDYVSVPELAINYQVVSLEKDSVQQGEDVNLSFYVYNVGESTADSFKVKVELVKLDNSRELIYDVMVDSIGSELRKKFDVNYNTTSFNGTRTFAISIDYENKISELYEDNNFYNIPFNVVGDTTKPSLTLTIDGNDIFDGEYISSKPNIKVVLSEPSLIPITDTSSISIFLNNRYIKYGGNENELNINFSDSNPKVTVKYTPTLEDGEYTLRIFGKDASGNISDSSGITKSFVVQNDPNLLDVFNFPNPFADNTYFTFKLTQIPDEIKIKIFTITGRLIKDIELNSSQLNYDLNKIFWDGKDKDGDKVGNGVYLYKVIMDVDGVKKDITQKLAIVR